MTKLTDEQKENIALWAEALTSGKYIQGQGRLFSSDRRRWCCLGVCGEVLGIPASSHEDVLLDFREFKLAVGLGFVDQDDLAKANDEGATFEHIANCLLAFAETGILRVP